MLSRVAVRALSTAPRSTLLAVRRAPVARLQARQVPFLNQSWASMAFFMFCVSWPIEQIFR
jgi:hypothetical protein